MKTTELKQWLDDASPQTQLLQLLVRPKVFTDWRTELNNRLSKAAVRKARTRGVADASLLTLDLPGDPNDKNFAYFARRGIQLAENDGAGNRGAGRTLRGFLGSPNFRHEGPVTCLAIHPTQPWVLSGSYDSTLKLWEVESGREIRTFAGHEGGVTACAFSGDGGRVLSGSDDSTLKLWEVESTTCLRTWRLTWTPTGIAWSMTHPGRVAVAGANGTVTLWDVFADASVGSV